MYLCLLFMPIAAGIGKTSLVQFASKCGVWVAGHGHACCRMTVIHVPHADWRAVRAASAWPGQLGRASSRPTHAGRC